MERRWGVRDFEWDDANEGHIARHGVTPAEAEEVFTSRVRVARSRWGRYAVLGRTAAGRHLALIVERLGGGILRVVTARDMAAREARLYRGRRR